MHVGKPYCVKLVFQSPSQMFFELLPRKKAQCLHTEAFCFSPLPWLTVKSISCSPCFTDEIPLKGCVQIRLMRSLASEWKRELGREHSCCWKNIKDVKESDFVSSDYTVSKGSKLPCLCWVSTTTVLLIQSTQISWISSSYKAAPAPLSDQSNSHRSSEI